MLNEGSGVFIFMVTCNRVPTPENDFCNNLLGTLNAISSTIILLFCVQLGDVSRECSWVGKQSRFNDPAPRPRPALRTRTVAHITRSFQQAVCEVYETVVFSIVRCTVSDTHCKHVDFVLVYWVTGIGINIYTGFFSISVNSKLYLKDNMPELILIIPTKKTITLVEPSIELG